jgi:hypothetical protein
MKYLIPPSKINKQKHTDKEGFVYSLDISKCCNKERHWDCENNAIMTGMGL